MTSLIEKVLPPPWSVPTLTKALLVIVAFETLNRPDPRKVFETGLHKNEGGGRRDEIREV